MPALTRAPRSLPANGDLVQQVMYDRGLSEREAARQGNIGQSVLRRLIRQNEVTSALQLATLRTFCDALGIALVDLLDPQTEQPNLPPDTPEDDIRTLTGILMEDNRFHSVDRIAMALDWSLPRLYEAIEHVNTVLAPLDVHIVEIPVGIAIRPRRRGHSHALRRLKTQRDADSGIPRGRAQTLYAIYKGDLTTRFTGNDTSVQLGALKNVGAILTPNPNSDSDAFELSQETVFCFDIP